MGGQDHLSAMLLVPASAENFFQRNPSFILVAPALCLPQESTSIFEAERWVSVWNSGSLFQKGGSTQ